MKWIITVLAVMSATCAWADDGGFFASSSGSAALTSEYVFRGITQSRENPAVQAGMSFGQATGPYAGAWGSSIDFNDGGEAHLELDLSGGYKWRAGPVTLDTGVIYYTYPGAADHLHYNYVEGKLGVSGQAGPAAWSLAAFLSPDYFAGSGHSLYLNAGASVPVSATGFSVSAAVGHQSIADNAAFGTPDYTDWNAGVSYAWKGFTAAVMYYDTSIDRQYCQDGCEGRVVASITRNF